MQMIIVLTEKGKMMERTCKNCMYEYGRLLPNPCGECSFVDNDRFIPKDDEVKKMFKSEIIKFEQLSGENAEITSISRIGGFLDGYHKAMEKQQWIPCSERLPEKIGDYLVSVKRHGWNCEEYIENDIAYWDDLEGFHKAEEVLAWMPLPEPYKEDGDG